MLELINQVWKYRYFNLTFWGIFFIKWLTVGWLWPSWKYQGSYGYQQTRYFRPSASQAWSIRSKSRVWITWSGNLYSLENIALQIIFLENNKANKTFLLSKIRREEWTFLKFTRAPCLSNGTYVTSSSHVYAPTALVPKFALFAQKQECLL